MNRRSTRTSQSGGPAGEKPPPPRRPPGSGRKRKREPEPESPSTESDRNPSPPLSSVASSDTGGSDDEHDVSSSVLDLLFSGGQTREPRHAIFIRRSTIPIFASKTAPASSSTGLPKPQQEEEQPQPLNELQQLIHDRELDLIQYQTSTAAVGALSLHNRILLSGCSNDVKTILFRKLREAVGLTGCTPEGLGSVNGANTTDGARLIGYIEAVLSFPFGVKKPIVLKGATPGLGREVDIMSHLRQVKENLDRVVYKHDQAKLMILSYVARILYNPDGRAHVALLLNGPPGVGKTRLLRAGVAQSLDLPFQTVSLSGVRDTSVILGHSPTYVGARMGRIAAAICAAQSLRAVIMLDELDKVGQVQAGDGSTGATTDLTSVLLQATDPESNSEWDADSYFYPIKLDVSSVVWVAASNDKMLINPIMRDRMFIIDCQPLTQQDRAEVLQRVVFPEAVAEAGLGGKVDRLTEAAAKHLLVRAEAAGTSGMRDLKRTIGTLVDRIVLVDIALRAGEVASLSDLFPFAKRPMPYWTSPLQVTEEWIDFLLWEPDLSVSTRSNHYNMYS